MPSDTFKPSRCITAILGASPPFSLLPVASLYEVPFPAQLWISARVLSVPPPLRADCPQIDGHNIFHKNRRISRRSKADIRLET